MIKRQRFCLNNEGPRLLGNIEWTQWPLCVVKCVLREILSSYTDLICLENKILFSLVSFTFSFPTHHSGFASHWASSPAFWFDKCLLAIWQCILVSKWQEGVFHELTLFKSYYTHVHTQHHCIWMTTPQNESVAKAYLCSVLLL